MPGSGKYSQLSRYNPNTPLPPSVVSLQKAYDGGATIALLSGKPIDVRDAGEKISWNVDAGSQKVYTDYNIEARGGATSHLINQPITSTLTITQNQLDRVNINYTNDSYIYTLPNDTLNAFPDGSQFELLQIGATGQITLNWPVQVSVNGVTNGSINLVAPYQRCVIRKISQNVYTSFNVGTPINPARGRFTPVITSSSGCTSATGQNGLYVGDSINPGSIVDVTMRLLIETNGSGENCGLVINTPIPANFLDFFDAEINCNPLIREDLSEETTGNIGMGWGVTLRANNDNDIYFVFECANVNTGYVVNLSYKFLIGSAALLQQQKSTLQRFIVAPQLLKKQRGK